jgi:hypothetical protein
MDKNLSDALMNLNNLTTYKSAFQDYTRRSSSSFDTTNNKNDEQINTIQPDDDHEQRSRSASLIKMPKTLTPFKRSASFTKMPEALTPLKRSVSSFQQKHQSESLQLNEDDEEEQQEKEKEIILPPIKKKESWDQDESAKSRKIRELQNKLSRQEEEAKKQINELQSKQSRLENALKLLVQQTSTYGKRRQQNHEDTESKKLLFSFFY